MPAKKSINNIDTSRGGYTKAEIESRKDQEKKLNGKCDNFKVPDFLKGNKVAIKEFKRLSNELKDKSVLSNIDNIQLGLYCQCYSGYCECVELEKQRGLFAEYTNKGGETNLVEAPWVKLRRQLETQMINIAKSFGFSPVDRLKFVNTNAREDEEDPLIKLLNKKRNK